MALDFPSSPVDGQIFGSYVWSSAKSVWQSREESATVAITSPIAPPSANNGDLWYNTERGITYIYYDDGTSAQWVEVVSSGTPSLETVMPVGSVIQTARVSAPGGWLLCQGQLISRTTYAALFNAIGTTYGIGDGSTTFSLPDLRGRVPVGQNASTFSSLGSTGGAEAVTLTESQIPSHTHTTPNHSHTFSGTTSTGGSHTHTIYGALINRGTGAQFRELTESSNPSQNNVASAAAGDHSHTYSGTTSNASPTTNATGGGQSHTNLQPYIVLNYMIKV